jgi:peptidoglycan/xylan/chitin deacetylase (PgdA/CDA1 family)
MTGLGGAAFSLAAVARPACAQTGRGQTGRDWPGGARAAVSLTYDDGLNSQLDNAVPELDRLGLKATFFLTEQNILEGGRLADWARVAREGHEVANHTVTHPCALGRVPPEQFARGEIEPMESFLDRNFGPARARTFAYPCGYLGVGRGERRERYARYRQILERDGVIAARTTSGRPNRVGDVLADRFNLHAFEPTDEADLIGPARRYLADAAAEGAWAILVFHDVLPRWGTEGDASIGVHRRILEHVAESGFWCAPMGQVFAHVQRLPRLTVAQR